MTASDAVFLPFATLKATDLSSNDRAVRFVTIVAIEQNRSSLKAGLQRWSKGFSLQSRRAYCDYC